MRGAVWKVGERWAFAVRLDTTDRPGRQLKRSGFKARRAAEAELDHVRALVALFDRDDPRRLTMGDRIFADSRRGGALPDVEEARRKVGAGLDPSAPSMTVGDWLDRWVLASHGRRESTKEIDRGYIKMYLRPHLGDVPLDRLRADHIDELFAWFERRNAQAASGEPVPDDPLDPRTRVRVVGLAAQPQVFSCLRSALAVAERRRLIPYNPCRQVELPHAPRRERPVWDRSQVARFLATTADDRLHAAYRVVLLGGLRRGEVSALKWEDVTWETGRLHVERQRIYLDGAVVETDLKTESSTRIVSLDPETVAVLRAHRKMQLQERLAAGAAYEDRDYVFARADGSPYLPKDLTYRFQQLARWTGLPVIRLHDGRHTAATLGLAAGVPVKVMSGRLGHANTAIIQDLYQHVLADMDDAAAALIAAQVAGPPV